MRQQCNNLLVKQYKLEQSENNLNDIFLNNQPDALIIPILFCYKTLHVPGIFSAHHQEFSTVQSALVSFMQVSDDRFQAESGCSILNLLLPVIRSFLLYIRHW
jgi:hypothetical protein